MGELVAYITVRLHSDSVPGDDRADVHGVSVEGMICTPETIVESTSVQPEEKKDGGKKSPIPGGCRVGWCSCIRGAGCMPKRIETA